MQRVCHLAVHAGVVRAVVTEVDLAVLVPPQDAVNERRVLELVPVIDRRAVDHRVELILRRFDAQAAGRVPECAGFGGRVGEPLHELPVAALRVQAAPHPVFEPTVAHLCCPRRRRERAPRKPAVGLGHAVAVVVGVAPDQQQAGAGLQRQVDASVAAHLGGSRRTGGGAHHHPRVGEGWMLQHRVAGAKARRRNRSHSLHGGTRGQVDAHLHGRVAFQQDDAAGGRDQWASSQHDVIVQRCGRRRARTGLAGRRHAAAPLRLARTEPRLHPGAHVQRHLATTGERREGQVPCDAQPRNQVGLDIGVGPVGAVSETQRGAVAGQQIPGAVAHQHLVEQIGAVGNGDGVGAGAAITLRRAAVAVVVIIAAPDVEARQHRHPGRTLRAMFERRGSGQGCVHDARNPAATQSAAAQRPPASAIIATRLITAAPAGSGTSKRHTCAARSVGLAAAGSPSR